jgi:hypothetical protein
MRDNERSEFQRAFYDSIGENSFMLVFTFDICCANTYLLVEAELERIWV